MFEAIKAQGYGGSYVRVSVHVRKLRQELGDAPHRSAFVPLTFAHGEAFQFDWSCEYAWIGGLRRRVEVSHCKLPCSRAFWLVAYPAQSHEMLFDAHTRSIGCPALFSDLGPDLPAPILHILLDDAFLPAGGDIAKVRIEQVRRRRPATR
jgi:hypothetical protein